MSWTLRSTQSVYRYESTTDLNTNGMTVETLEEAEEWWECWSMARTNNRSVSTMTDNSNNTVVKVRLQ